jgi:two-component system sensor kinase FixL
MPVPDLFPKGAHLNVLTSIVETAIDGILLIDSQGTILMVNTAGTDLFGFSQEEMLGQNISMLMPPPDRENHDTYIHNYQTTGIKKIIGIGREVQGRKKDGSLFPVRLAVSYVMIEGKPYFTGILQDITAMKAAQQRIINLNNELKQNVIDKTAELQETVNLLLETNQQLKRSIEKHKSYESALLATRDELKKSLAKEKELNSLKSRFVSMTSHEFKTPLSSILSSASLISKYVTTEQETDRSRHVERIKSSVNHLNGILLDFLSLTRIDEGHLTPVISSFSVKELLVHLQAETQDLLKKDQKLICIHEIEDFRMNSDKNVLRNILYNLLSNAIKYSDEGKKILCSVSTAQDQIKISITDEGMGIPEEDQKHIGSRFFRATNVINVPGTGLGLNIVLSYLHTLKGELSFVSHQGEGTTFTIQLPLNYEK